MGGEVGVESTPGQGSRFWFRVPLEPLPAASDSRATPRATSRSAEPTDSPHLKGQVLIVEDYAFNQMLVETMLQKIGLTTQTVDNGQQAVEAVMAETHPIDAILMDLQMPVMDGHTATAHIRAWEQTQQRNRLPIIALTADAFPEDRARCLSVGMDDYLSKPLVMNDLIAVLTKWLPTAQPGTEPPPDAI
jgi:CheY-like chemotaxis protein